METLPVIPFSPALYNTASDDQQYIYIYLYNNRITKAHGHIKLIVNISLYSEELSSPDIYIITMFKITI